MQFKINLDNEKLEMFDAERDVSFYHVDFMVSFLGVHIQKNISNFSFTYTFTDVEDGNVIKTFDGNLDNLHRLISATGGLHVVDRVSGLLPNNNYALQIVCNYAGKESVYDLDILTPFPPKNYDSWVWNQSELSWEAPIPYPEDGLKYNWNEDLVDWELVEVIEES
jgi:hypothetical protein